MSIFIMEKQTPTEHWMFHRDNHSIHHSSACVVLCVGFNCFGIKFIRESYLKTLNVKLWSERSNENIQMEQNRTEEMINDKSPIKWRHWLAPNNQRMANQLSTKIANYGHRTGGIGLENVNKKIIIYKCKKMKIIIGS